MSNASATEKAAISEPDYWSQVKINILYHFRFILDCRLK